MSDPLPLVHYRFECGDLPCRVRALVLRERLDRPFEAEIELIVGDHAHPDDFLDKPATLTFAREDVTRTFRGEATRIELASAGEDGVRARVRFEPTLLRAARVKRSRIFQDLSVVDIVQQVLLEVPNLRLEAQLDLEPRVRDYCVQYEESDFSFVCRLLEDEGIAWYLDDGGDEQVMRLVDAARGFLAISGFDGDVRLIPDRFDLVGFESMQSLIARRRSRSPGVVERDWQWFDGSVGAVEAAFPADARDPRVAVHHPRRWASATLDASVRREYERLAIDELEVTGTSIVTAFAVGHHFRTELAGESNTAILLKEVLHEADCPDAEPRNYGEPGAANYTNSFVGRLLDVAYRPAREVERPRIHGVHTAVVTGPENEEIFTDEHGRIRVRMHWDRSDSPPESSTCWLRVAQSWAGAGWGAMVIPRVGMEVLVAFLDGDPDRPMCIGCVYNGTNTPPYPLPDEKTKTTLRSNSSPGGDGFNELTFEDRKDAEQVFLHAQRDLVEKVKRNETMSIGSDRGISVGRNDTLSVGGDQKVTVDGNQTLTVSGGGKQGTKGTEVAIKGLCKVAVTDPGEVEIYAGSKITLQCGASKIVIDKTSIKIFAGSGAYTNLDTAIFSQSSNGASTELKAAVTVKSMQGSAFVLDGKVSSTSADGASVVLDKEVNAKAVDGAQLTLNADAALGGAKASVEAAQGSWLVLDTAADLGGAVKTTCSGPGGQLEVAAAGVTIDGAQVEINGATKVAMLSALVSAN